MLVEWEDAFFKAGYTSVKKAKKDKAAKQWSVGFLVQNSEKYLSLAMTDDGKGGCCDVLTIPQAWIISVKLL